MRSDCFFSKNKRERREGKHVRILGWFVFSSRFIVNGSIC